MSKNNSNQLDHIIDADNSGTAFSANSIKDVISKLRTTIDRYFADAKDLILELARRLDETKQIKPRRVCITIKEIVRDKIAEGKITERWIEESLPPAYKRKYTKSEPSSHLRNDKKEKKQVDNAEENLFKSPYSNSSDLDNSTQMETIDESDDRSNGSCTKRQEFDETLPKTSSMASRIILAKNEIKFKMPEEKGQQMKIALQSNLTCYWLICNMMTGSLVRFVSCETDK